MMWINQANIKNRMIRSSAKMTSLFEWSIICLYDKCDTIPDLNQKNQVYFFCFYKIENIASPDMQFFSISGSQGLRGFFIFLFDLF